MGNEEVRTIDIEGIESYEFSNVEEDVSFFRTTLLQNGLKYGDRVGILIPNSYEFV